MVTTLRKYQRSEGKTFSGLFPAITIHMNHAKNAMVSCLVSSIAVRTAKIGRQSSGKVQSLIDTLTE